MCDYVVVSQMQLPYMAVYTSDLTHIEDGNDDRVMDSLINFDKMRMIARVWRDMSRFQNPRRAYCFEPIPAVQQVRTPLAALTAHISHTLHELQWFAALPPIDDNELYALSLAIEVRIDERLVDSFKQSCVILQPRVAAASSENRPRTNSLSRLFGGNKN
jgi:hypothetical protein